MSSKRILSKEDQKRIARYGTADYEERLKQKQATIELVRPVVDLFKFLYEGTAVCYHESQKNIVRNNAKSIEDAFQRYSRVLMREGTTAQQTIWEKARKSFKIHRYFYRTWRRENVSDEVYFELTKKLLKKGTSPEETIREYKELLVSYGANENTVLLFQVSSKHFID